MLSTSITLRDIIRSENKIDKALRAVVAAEQAYDRYPSGTRYNLVIDARDHYDQMVAVGVALDRLYDSQ